MSTVNSNNEQPQKLAPNSQPSEEAVLGSVLINPEILPDLLTFLKADDFYYMHHRFVWESLVALFDLGQDIDVVTVCEDLTYRKDKDGQSYLNKIGGGSFVTYLINNTPTHVHAETYARIVERLATRRRMLDAASEVAKVAIADDIELEEAIRRAEKFLAAAIRRPNRSEGLIPMSEAVPVVFNQVLARYENRDEPQGIPTGFKKIDYLLGGGMQKSDFLILAGRPGSGKTTLSLTICMNAAQELLRAKGKRRAFDVAFFSLEMSRDQLVQRLYSSATNIDSRKLRNADLSPEQWDSFMEATSRLEKFRLMIDDSPRQTVRMIENALKGKRKDLIVIDYLQLMFAAGYSGDRVGMFSEISRSLKELAKREEVPVLALAQLSRAVDGRSDKRPVLSDLKDSGSFEQDADVVMFIYDDSMYNPVTVDNKNKIELIIAKQRNGPTGSDHFYFQKDAVRIAELTKPILNINLASL